jgi:tripartite-type tricarboxylate transporter receptor subunit TctC
VPQLSSLVTDPKGQELVALVQSQGDIARLTAGPPGIPADITAALVGAYKQAMEDKDLQQRAEKLERPVEPLYGEDVLKAVKAALNQKPETITLLKEALGK